MRESKLWRRPNYRGYVSVICRDDACGKKIISPANRFKRNRENQILCPSCYQVANVFPLPAEARPCPVCGEEFSSTNPSRKYCNKDCADKVKEYRKEADKIRKGKKRKRAVREISDFLNG